MTEEPRAPRSFRRHIATLILLLGGLLIGNYLCVARDKLVAVDIRYELGSPPVARRIDVSIVPRSGGDAVVTFWREPAAPTTQHRPRMPPGMYLAEITMTRPDGTIVRVSRPFEARADAVITIDLRSQGTEPR